MFLFLADPGAEDSGRSSMVINLETAVIIPGGADFFTTGKGVLRGADNADDGVFLSRRRALLCEASAHYGSHGRVRSPLGVRLLHRGGEYCSCKTAGCCRLCLDLIAVVGCATISADLIGIGDVIARPIQCGWCVLSPTTVALGGVAIGMAIGLCLGVERRLNVGVVV